jgi:N-acetyl-gamma-glutamylphosphate reductase
MKSARTLLAAGKKVVDLGADFRLKDREAYRTWYKGEPASAELLSQAVYGVCEIYRSQVQEAQEKVVTVVRQMAEAGTISLRTNTDDMVV